MKGTRWMGWAQAALFAHHLALAPPARATTMHALSVEQLVDEAELVVVGLSVAADAFHADAALTRIQTQARIRVAEIWKGALPAGADAVDVVTLGGQMGDVAQVVDGAAHLPVGGLAVLFLVRAESGTGEYEVLGLTQGAWHLGPRELPIPADAPVSSLSLLPRPTRHPPRPAGAPQTFGELKRAVGARLGSERRFGPA